MDGRRCYEAADHPLTDEEIRQRFSRLFDEGFGAFLTDPNYYLLMMEHGTILTYRAKMKELETELSNRAPRKNETRSNMLKRVAKQRGITIPQSTTIRSKVKDRPSQVV